MYNNIIVPVDLGHPDTARRILKIAAKLASKDAQVSVLHVLPEIPAYVETYVPQDLRDKSAEEYRGALEELAREAGLNAKVLIGHGAAHMRILDLVSDLKPDLVIIGSHHPGMSDYFLGSTAARVVRHADCSVLVDR